MKNKNLDRVSLRIKWQVLRFMNRRKVFRLEELTTYVIERLGAMSPESPSRVLRDLRKKGLVNYKVIDRSSSRYEVLK